MTTINRRRSMARDEHGASAVLVAASLLLLMGFLALGIDGGNLYQERRAAQDAADQSALAAAFTECEGGTEAQAIAAGHQAAAANGYDDAAPDVSVTITREGQHRYRAVVSTDVDGSFSRALGLPDLGTGASAVVSCTPGNSGGTTLHAHATGCAGHPELLVSGDSVEVNGGSHSNGDFKTSGDDVTLNDGTTYGETWDDSADNTVVDPTQQPGSTSKEWPYEYLIEDYDDITDHPAGLWHLHTGNTTLSGPIPAGVHYVTGNLNINDITIAPVGLETGVTFVAEGRIRTITDTLSITAYSGANGLLMFSNNVTECDGNLNDDLAIDSQTDNADYKGVLFAPHGKILLKSNGALAVAVWGYFVELRGDPNISLTYPDNAPQGDPELQFEE